MPQFTLHVRSYVADPYWPAREKIVTIQKHSGMNRARSTDRKDQSLRRYLEKIGMSYEEYAALEVEAAKPWYRDVDGHIVIPRHHLSGCLVEACKTAPAGCRFSPDQLRSLLQIGDFHTKMTERTCLFERFVKPTDPKGHALSNQRRFTSSEVIEDFLAVGDITYDETDVKGKAVRELLSYAGKYIGVGASRKMGYGRFTVPMASASSTATHSTAQHR